MRNQRRKSEPKPQLKLEGQTTLGDCHESVTSSCKGDFFVGNFFVENGRALRCHCWESERLCCLDAAKHSLHSHDCDHEYLSFRRYINTAS